MPATSMIPHVPDPRDWKLQQHFDERVKYWLDGFIRNSATEEPPTGGGPSILPFGWHGPFVPPVTTFQNTYEHDTTRGTFSTACGHARLSDPGGINNPGGTWNTILRYDTVPSGWTKMTAIFTPQFERGASQQIGVMLRNTSIATSGVGNAQLIAMAIINTPAPTGNEMNVLVEYAYENDAEERTAQ